MEIFNTKANGQAILVYNEKEDNFKAYMCHNKTKENIKTLDDVLGVVKDSIYGRSHVVLTVDKKLTQTYSFCNLLIRYPLGKKN